MKPAAPSRRALWLILLAGLGLSAALFAACGGLGSPRVTPTPTRTPRPTATPTPSPTPTPAWPVSVYVPEGLPAPVSATLRTTLAEHPDFFTPAASAESASVLVALDPGPEATLLAEWVYALAAPFPTLVDEVAWADVVAGWGGSPAGSFAGRPLLMDADTHRVLTALLGPSADGAVSVTPGDQLADTAWAGRPAWAAVPFDWLEPRWKALRIDAASVLDRNLDTGTYPLVVRVGATGAERGIAKLQELTGGPLTNRDPDRMTVLMMTGVTALTRCTAYMMEREGVTFPGRDVRDWLLEPDITHISNEVSFAEGCKPASCEQVMVFCSSPRYVELIEDLDIDVVELTGNHLLDWGVGAMELSLEMYDGRGIPYFGGGWNVTQAQAPLTLTHGVHTFGFVGCNVVGPDFDWATDGRPGAAPCNFNQLYARIRGLRDQGVIPIVTLQYWEFNRYEPTPQQRVDFHTLAEAGAVIVSGSQAHQPQGFDFHAGAFIHYGLGNLFFDQMQKLEYRQEFLDRHMFYDGRHISTEVLTAMLEDYARPRPMSPDERAALLKIAFQASGW